MQPINTEYQIEHRQRFYNPSYGNRIYTQSFIKHTTDKVINSLSDIDQNNTYFEGWIRVTDLAQMRHFYTVDGVAVFLWWSLL